MEELLDLVFARLQKQEHFVVEDKVYFGTARRLALSIERGSL